MNKPRFNILAEKHLLEMAYGLGNYQTISQSDLIKVFTDFDEAKLGAKPVSLTSITIPGYRKKMFPYKALYKVGQTAGMVGTDYGKNVNAQRERESKPADFIPQPNSKVKEWISPSVGITTRDLIVLKYRPLNPQPSYWVVEDNNQNLVEIPGDEAKTYLYSSGNSANQGLDQQIEYRLFGFDKIVGVAFQNKEYLVNDIGNLRQSIFNVVEDKLKS